MLPLYGEKPCSNPPGPRRWKRKASLEKLRERKIRVRRLCREVGREPVIAHPEVQRDVAFKSPSVLQVEAGIPKIVLLSRWGVVGHNFEGRREGLRPAVVDSVDALTNFVNVGVVAVAPLETKLEIVIAAPIRLVPRAACGPFQHPRRILKFVGCCA